MRRILEHRAFISWLLAAGVGMALFIYAPFPHNLILQAIAEKKPYIYEAIRWTYTAMLFSTPYIVFSLLLTLGYVFGGKTRKRTAGKLPPYTPPDERNTLYLTLGEMHNPKKLEPAEEPRWLDIGERGLYTGIAIFGAIGSGKTSGCMYPYAEQILGYCPRDEERRAGALVLEVKGDFCYKVRGLLKKYNREDDYLEIALDSKIRYNPLHNDLDAYALAYGIASLLNNLFGKSKEAFWQQAYTNLVKFIILLHKTVDDYVTLFDVYECAINPGAMITKITEGEAKFNGTTLVVGADVYLATPELDQWTWESKPGLGMSATYAADLEHYLQTNAVPYDLITQSGGTVTDQRKRQQFEAVKRWFYNDWMRIEPKLRTSIVEGISVFLSLFDDNPSVKYAFCPPKEAYDRKKNADGKHGIPLPAFGDLIESGKVIALNFPASGKSAGLARVIGTLLKLDFQGAMLERIPQIELNPKRHYRPVMFLCDEYQAFATCGENDPTGDEKFFALSRQAKCIPIVATQSIASLKSTLPGESWRTLLQTFRTKIFLTLSDDFSAKTASDLCGKEEQLTPSFALWESGQDANVSIWTGRPIASKSSMGANKSYALQRNLVFEPKVFAELKNAQSIVLAYTGTDPLPPVFCMLKPSYLSIEMNYFEQLKRGLL